MPVADRASLSGQALINLKAKEMRSDELLQKDVQDAIKWEPLLHAAEVGVIAGGGIITLTGTVNSYAKKVQAVEAARSVAGVKAVADDMNVRPEGSAIMDDTTLALEVIRALKSSWSVPNDTVRVTVADGWVTLEGILHWDFQRQAAKNAIRYLTGVRGVISRLTIESEIRDEIEKERVEQALRRNWAIESDRILVRAHGTTITLSGIVSSLFQKDQAEHIAYKTPGVWLVENLLVVEHD